MRKRGVEHENKLNLAGALWLAQMVFPMSEIPRIVLSVALGALVARIAWLWVQPSWARYPAAVGALAVLTLLLIQSKTRTNVA